MSEFKIDDDVPMPPPAGPRAKGKSKYPFAELSVGRSFFAPGVSSSGMLTLCKKWREARGWDFTTRRVTENGVSGVRVWRIE